ncbi:Chitin synthase regulatory factor 3 [Neolecta irregularis DAH-3]|uniref:Chitin synthase regulatory factor 3 n=1 Tax=Neolecta irregularis (strain DAH-3) TaxID=1198029 RepID=A0A1U7LK86_NEOID|nr:Chitin synthase regulatory factor 3 [Neolecta irregularis DAH-3]|eukprot:OLL22962.1 Chitin synthase regulatory factor 3 [Neolecta irregularis DAH-3]
MQQYPPRTQFRPGQTQNHTRPYIQSPPRHVSRHNGSNPSGPIQGSLPLNEGHYPAQKYPNSKDRQRNNSRTPVSAPSKHMMINQDNAFPAFPGYEDGKGPRKGNHSTSPDLCRLGGPHRNMSRHEDCGNEGRHETAERPDRMQPTAAGQQHLKYHTSRNPGEGRREQDRQYSVPMDCQYYDQTMASAQELDRGVRRLRMTDNEVFQDNSHPQKQNPRANFQERAFQQEHHRDGYGYDEYQSYPQHHEGETINNAYYGQPDEQYPQQLPPPMREEHRPVLHTHEDFSSIKYPPPIPSKIMEYPPQISGPSRANANFSRPNYGRDDVPLEHGYGNYTPSPDLRPSEPHSHPNESRPRTAGGSIRPSRQDWPDHHIPNPGQHYHPTNEYNNQFYPEHLHLSSGNHSPPLHKQHPYDGHPDYTTQYRHENSYFPERYDTQRPPYNAPHVGGAYSGEVRHDLPLKHPYHPSQEDYQNSNFQSPSPPQFSMTAPPSHQVPPVHPPPIRIGQLPKSQPKPRLDPHQQRSLISQNASPHPAPQRHHSGTSSKSKDSLLPPQPVAIPPPVTKQELADLNERVRVTNDEGLMLTYAKKLVEAAIVLADDGGRADDKQIRRNRENYTTEAQRLVKRLVSHIGNKPYPKAMFFLANCHGNGQMGLQIDHEKAFHLYHSAAKLQHAASAYRMAVCYEVGAGTKKDLAKAITAYRQAASLGDTASLYKLGMISLNGLLNQERDFSTAVSWLTKAASQADINNPHALHEMGLLFERPDASKFGLQHNEKKAFKHFMEAAKLYYAPAMFKLGCCFEYGSLGCPMDAKRSVAWYTRAAEKGDSESELALSGWYLTGADCLKQSDTEAYLWARKAAEQGLPKAEFAVGYYTEVGIGCQSDLEQAKKWYVRAASQQQKDAKDRLAELKRSGNTYKRPAQVTRAQVRRDTDSCLVM